MNDRNDRGVDFDLEKMKQNLQTNVIEVPECDDAEELQLWMRKQRKRRRLARTMITTNIIQQ